MPRFLFPYNITKGRVKWLLFGTHIYVSELPPGNYLEQVTQLLCFSASSLINYVPKSVV